MRKAVHANAVVINGTAGTGQLVRRHMASVRWGLIRVMKYMLASVPQLASANQLRGALLVQKQKCAVYLTSMARAARLGRHAIAVCSDVLAWYLRLAARSLTR